MFPQNINNIDIYVEIEQLNWLTSQGNILTNTKKKLRERRE